MKKYIIIFIFLTNVLFASDYFTKAENYLKEGKLEIALLFYNKELNENIDNWKAYFHRGKIYFYKKEYEKALDDFKKAYQIKTSDPELLYALGNAYASLNDADNAISFYKKTLRKDKNFAYAYLNMGIVYLKLKKDKKNTIKNWEKFLEAMPDYYQNPDIRKAINYLKSPDFNFKDSKISTSLSENYETSSSNKSNISSDTNDKLIIPDLLIPDIKGEGKKAPVSKPKESEKRKSIETD